MSAGFEIYYLSEKRQLPIIYYIWPLHLLIAMRSLLLILLMPFYTACHATVPDSLLHELEQQMALRKQYDLKKEGRIKQLKQLLAEPSLSDVQIYDINNRLIKEYIPYQFKKALCYISINIQLGEKLHNPLFTNKAKLHLAGVLSSSGNYTEAGDILRSINKKRLSENLLGDYYYTQMWLHYRLRFYSPVKSIREKYTRGYREYADSLKQHADPQSELYLSAIETGFRDNGDFGKSREANLKRLAMARPGEKPYSSITFFLAQGYLQEKDTVRYKEYLIKSAISDIKSSVKDNASLSGLAVMLFHQGDVERAHKFINFAFEDAAFYNSRLRLSSLSEILPIINKAYDDEIQRQKSRLQGYLVLISALSLLVLLTLVYIWRQFKYLTKARKRLQVANDKLHELNNDMRFANEKLGGLYNELAETNLVKEYYIGNLLNLCSEYLDKLDVYRKTVQKMIVAKKISELFEKTKSPEMIDAEINLFYKNFDIIFLKIYPDFVAQFNQLLLPDESIILKNGELLNTELRIFALIRLGITDSSRIAKLLRYSVNTIYNYRVKIKNKALISRDEFETQVTKIGSFAKAATATI